MGSTRGKSKNTSDLDLLSDLFPRSHTLAPASNFKPALPNTDDPVQHVVEVQLVHRNLFNVRKEVR